MKSCFFVLLISCAACRSQETYWWEEGYPFAESGEVVAVSPIASRFDRGGARASPQASSASLMQRAPGNAEFRGDADGLVLRAYDIRSLTAPRSDFAGPKMDRIFGIESVGEDDGPFVTQIDRAATWEADAIRDLVTETVEPESWLEQGVSISTANGLLIVRHERDVQRRIARLLAQLGGV